MTILHSIENFLQLLADGYFASIPRKRPGLEALKNCRIVSHRGEHDNKTVFENTLPAFDAILNHAIWGIEFDIRWTRDLQPVVIHDADCNRVFGSPLIIAEHTLAQIQTEIPEIPSLKQVIHKYGRKLHLMVELKQENFADIEKQTETLKKLFTGLTPSQDYHLLALETSLFDKFNFVPNSAMLPVSEFNLKTMSRQARENNYAGVCGQYLLISRRHIRNHVREQQKIGTGFTRSRFCFYRELNRNVEWIFTNHAIKLNRIRNQLLKQASI